MFLSVMPQEVSKRVPMIRVHVSIARSASFRHIGFSKPALVEIYVHILHTAPQARLYRVRVPSIEIHHERPTQTGENWPRVFRDLPSAVG